MDGWLLAEERLNKGGCGGGFSLDGEFGIL